MGFVVLGGYMLQNGSILKTRCMFRLNMGLTADKIHHVKTLQYDHDKSYLLLFSFGVWFEIIHPKEKTAENLAFF